MIVRQPTPPPPYPPPPPSYPHAPTPPPPPSPLPSPLPTVITLDPNVWGGNLPGQPDPTSHITQFTPFEELLCLRYGFLDDAGELPIGSSVQRISNDKAIRVLGYSKSSVPRLTLNASYLISLLATVSFQDNNIPIAHSHFNTTALSPHEHFTLSLFWCSSTKAVYIISNKGPQYFGWQLAFTNATTALECMRRSDKSIGELLSFLVQTGRIFMTHRRRDQIPPPTYHYPPPIIQSSFRSSSQLPAVQEDYMYYEQTRSNFLSQPRGRAALMQGGIVWRLALEHFQDRAEDVVANGPSDDVAVRWITAVINSGTMH